MAEFIFTFGSGQISPISGLSQGRYGRMRFIRIDAPDYNSARDRMVELYGLNWSMQYDASNGGDPAGIEEFGLVELEVLEVTDLGGSRRIEFESPRNAVMHSGPTADKGKKSP
jgi:hypothetical protein